MIRRQCLLFMALSCVACLSWSRPTAAQEAAAPRDATAKTAEPGTRRALIVCGLSGDEPHHTLFAETLVKLQAGLSARMGIASDNIRLLFGDEPNDADPSEIQQAGLSTREDLEKAVAEVRQTLSPQDSLWVFVLGHSHYDGTHAWLNLPGPDLHEGDFAKLFQGVAAAEQVFVIATPASGFFIKPLSAKGRVIISATEADWETNETEFPLQLAAALTEEIPLKEFDADSDGMLTLFDLYITLNRRLAQSYLDRQFLATEHPLLDDNGDGRGSDLQIDYLTEDQGGRVRPGRALKVAYRPGGDGELAKTIRLRDLEIGADATNR